MIQNSIIYILEYAGYFLQGIQKSQFYFSRDNGLKSQQQMCENQYFPCFDP